MNLTYYLRRNPGTQVEKRVRDLEKAMDADNDNLRDVAERDLRDMLLSHRDQIARKPLRTAVAKLVDASVEHERFGDLDALTELDRSAVTDELIFDIQRLAGRIGKFVSASAPDPSSLMERGGAPAMFDEEFPADDIHSAELRHMRHQLSGMIEKLKGLIGKNALTTVRRRSMGADFEQAIRSELNRYESERHSAKRDE